ncbi:anti-sigma factor [Foetidibacter luteolus]|uniref:anti-sigma factor n=1 Tax=Foetidibacter luteolus TaxID=2608880 RepID=UPI001A998949|nr:anti-sigma factor [Foetidibacter luteolus]
MNIQEYILSGIVESYVLGIADENDRGEFEQLCTQYPELVLARNKFEQSLEASALQHAVHPPEHLKASILASLQQPTPIASPKVITMQNGNMQARKTNWQPYLAAASVIVLLVCGYLIYQLRSTNSQLLNENQDLQARYKSTDSILNKIIDEQKVIRDSNITVVNMVGTQAAPRSSANIYWDSTSTNVFLVVKNMPKLPNEQQYQLWALIDGKPKDLGVFDASDDKVILKMNNTQKADAFAITIEQKGGNKSPTLEKMQSMGKTNL